MDKSNGKIYLKTAFIILLAAAFLMPFAQTAQACCSCKTSIKQTEKKQWYGSGDDSIVDSLIIHFENEFASQKQFLAGILWEDHMLPAMMLMTEQLSTIAMQQTLIIGQFFDAQQQLEAQRALQVLQARTHKDYTPSVGLCEIGSGARSLAASERKGEISALVMSQRSQDRNLGNANSAGSQGPVLDKESRLAQFKEKFCDVQDNGGGLDLLCGAGGSDPARLNKDIDYMRTLDDPWTLDVDFTDADLTDNEEEILALSSNLYGYDIFNRITASLASQPGQRITTMQDNYMDARALIAKRSVAENSFNAITAMKSAGEAGSKEYLAAVLKELGAGTDTEIETLLGGDNQVNPSYYAQMEVLTKKIFQNPDFYTNLYDKPVNVERKDVALQAIALMQKFDMLKSYLRNEASVSVLLELAVIDMQSDIENEINGRKAK